MSNWRIPINDKLPEIPATGPMPASLVGFATTLRKEASGNAKHHEWLRRYDERMGVNSPEDESVPSRHRPATTVSEQMNQQQAISGREALMSAARQKTEEKVNRRRTTERITEEELASHAQDSDGMFAGVASVEGGGQSPPPPPPPRPPFPSRGFGGSDGPDPFGRQPQPPSYVSPQLPMAVPTRPAYPQQTMPPRPGSYEEGEGEDGDDDEDAEDEREMVIDGRHLNMLVGKLEQMSNQVLLAMGENTRLARQSVEDARRNTESAVAAATKMSASAIENANKLSQAAINIATSISDVNKTMMNSMDNRMQKADESRLESMHMMENALIQEGHARAVLAGEGVAPIVPGQTDENTEMMGSLLGVALAKGGGAVVEKIMALFQTKAAMPEAAMKEAIASAVAEALAKAKP